LARSLVSNSLLFVLFFEIILAISMLILIRRGQVHLTRILYVSLFWMLPTVVMLFSGGVGSTGFSSYIVIVLMAALLINVRVGFLFAGISTLTGLVMLFLQSKDMLPTAVITDTPEFAWMGTTASFALAVVIVYITKSSLRRALSLERRNEEALVETNEELKYNRLELIDQTIELTKSNNELKREISRRKKVEQEKNKSILEKEVLLKEIHHRVKNNLQIISSLLYLQSKKLEDKKSREIFQDSQDRIRAMALIHEKLYQSDDLAKIELAGYIRSLVQSLFKAHGIDPQYIKYTIDAKDVFLGVDIAIPCGVIINELVSNSLKYAFPEGRKGAIWIKVKSDDEEGWILRVQDDGIGMSASHDRDNMGSLGLQLVNNLATQLGGSMRLNESDSVDIEVRLSESNRKLEAV